MVVVKKLIKKAIKQMEERLAPIQIIIKGPKATFGRELKIVKKGSNTLAKKGNLHRKLAHTILRKELARKESKTS